MATRKFNRDNVLEARAHLGYRDLLVDHAA
jgi:hypothetical protein